MSKLDRYKYFFGVENNLNEKEVIPINAQLYWKIFHLIHSK